MITIDSPLVRQVLESFQGKTAFLWSMDGNNGDELLRLGSLQCIAAAGIELAPSIEESDVVVVRGNGAMIEAYREPVADLVRLAALSPRPIVVLPSSWELTAQQLSPFLARSAETVLFAREKYSLNLLGGSGAQTRTTILLDHDVALGLDLEPLGIPVSESHDLIALRTDAEQAAPRPSIQRARSLYTSVVPPAIRSRARPIVAGLYSRVQASAHVRNSDDLYDENLPRIIGDVSDAGLYSFEEFCAVIGGARHVTTSRLHAGLLAARLGKETTLLPGATTKIQGIYEYSLASLPNVRLEAQDAAR